MLDLDAVRFRINCALKHTRHCERKRLGRFFYAIRRVVNDGTIFYIPYSRYVSVKQEEIDYLFDDPKRLPLIEIGIYIELPNNEYVFLYLEQRRTNIIFIPIDQAGLIGSIFEWNYRHNKSTMECFSNIANVINSDIHGQCLDAVIDCLSILKSSGKQLRKSLGDAHEARSCNRNPLHKRTTVIIRDPDIVCAAADNGGGGWKQPLHERRGHYREYKSGKRVWIKSYTAGNEEYGTRVHDYVFET